MMDTLSNVPIATDAAKPFPETGHGNKYITYPGSRRCKWIEAHPLLIQKAVTVATALVDN